jgi:hypothetical protein
MRFTAAKSQRFQYLRVFGRDKGRCSGMSVSIVTPTAAGLSRATLRSISGGTPCTALAMEARQSGA